MKTSTVSAVLTTAATCLGAALWFTAVGLSGPSCHPTSTASVEALFAPCVGGKPVSDDQRFVERPAVPRAPAATDEQGSEPAVAQGPLEVEATGSVTTLR